MRAVKVVMPAFDPSSPNDVSTGTGTKIFDAETGEEVRGILSLNIGEISADKIVSADIRMCCVSGEIYAYPKFLVAHPKTGAMTEVVSIRFADGTTFAPGRVAEG